jgi:hypothetical protein
MATKTVSASGGNFTAAGAWVGGVAPVTGDDIVANATSGNLTLTANTVGLSGANFTGYTRILNLASFIFNMQAGSTLTLATSSMTITQNSSSGRIQFASSASLNSTISSNGIVKMPYLQTAAGQTVSIAGTASVGFWQGNGAIINGGNVVYWGHTTTGGNITVREPYFCFIRPDNAFGAPPQTVMNFSRTVWDTATASFTNGSIMVTHLVDTYFRFDKTPAFYVLAGSTQSALTYYIQNIEAVNQKHTLDFGSSGFKFDLINCLTLGQAATSLTILSNNNDVKVGKFVLRPMYAANPGLTASYLNLISTSNLSIDELVVASDYGNMNTVTTQSGVLSVVDTARTVQLKLSSGCTFSIATINSSGVTPTAVSTPSTIISSVTASVPAKVIIGNTFSFDNTQIIDIDNLGSTPVYAFTFSNNTITRTTGITSSFPSSGGGGAGGSFTFVS